MPLDADIAASVSVTATLNYLHRSSEKPTRFLTAPPPGRAAWNGIADPREVRIQDARAFAEEFSLDRNGFALHRTPSAVGNFYDPDEIAHTYYPEVKRLLLGLLGASEVVVFDHNLRNAVRSQRGDPAAREPVQRVHNDYTFGSAPRRVRDLLGKAADRLLQHRFAVVNVWRPIRGPVLDAPLALCDAASFAEEDLIATDLVYGDRIGETYSVAYRPGHRWYYFSRMRPDEVLLIKCYDSATDRARLSFHTAFHDPTAPIGAAVRESIEVRTLVFFAPNH